MKHSTALLGAFTLLILSTLAKADLQFANCENGFHVWSTIPYYRDIEPEATYIKCIRCNHSEKAKEPKGEE